MTYDFLSEFLRLRWAGKNENWSLNFEANTILPVVSYGFLYVETTGRTLDYGLLWFPSYGFLHVEDCGMSNPRVGFWE